MQKYILKHDEGCLTLYLEVDLKRQLMDFKTYSCITLLSEFGSQLLVC